MKGKGINIKGEEGKKAGGHQKVITSSQKMNE